MIGSRQSGPIEPMRKGNVLMKKCASIVGMRSNTEKPAQQQHNTTDGAYGLRR